MLSTRNHLKTRDTYKLKVKGWKKIFHANGEQKKVEVAILTSYKIDFEIQTIKKKKLNKRVTIYSLNMLPSLFGTSVLFHAQF